MKGSRGSFVPAYPCFGGMNMLIVAIDDEQLARENLEDCIRKAVPKAEVVSFDNGEDSLEYVKKHPVDIVFSDIEIGTINGVNLATMMKQYAPKINIVFTTGYSDYLSDAFALHASGYILKPITEEKILNEIRELRYPIENLIAKKVQVKTFGSFEVTADGRLFDFKYSKTMELFAYLIDRNGASVGNSELAEVLWEDDEPEKHFEYLKKLKSDLKNTLEAMNLDGIVIRQWNKLSVNKDDYDCDYYQYLDGDKEVVKNYHGEYMSQYSWAEDTNGTLYEEILDK